jgi:hypothetical protein
MALLRFQRASMAVACLLTLVIPSLSKSVQAAGCRCGHQVYNPPLWAAAQHLSPGPGNWTSDNWSGYATKGRPSYEEVSASWTVPVVEATQAATHSALWIGIGGFNDNSVIQVGTEQDYAGGGRYYAWWETYPDAEVRIDSLPVNPGDLLVGSIKAAGGNSWTISLRNHTSGQTFSVQRTYGGSRQSAEWIMEAPNIGSTPSELSHYGQTTVSPLTANQSSPGLTPSDGGVMNQHGNLVSVPSDPAAGGDGFSLAYGSHKPPPPR